jgi:spore germination cell wall hydrolase CwlJ-like protein
VPILAYVLVVFTVYQLVLYNISIIKSDPVNKSYITIQERDREVNCLAENIYYEGAGEDAEGKVGIAQVTINRAKSGKFPSDICKVIHQKYQFSWTMNKPKALRVKDEVAYNESKEVAVKVLMEGYRLPSLTNSLYYHNHSVNPKWNRHMNKDAVIGGHIFWSVS